MYYLIIIKFHYLIIRKTRVYIYPNQSDIYISMLHSHSFWKITRLAFEFAAAAAAAAASYAWIKLWWI